MVTGVTAIDPSGVETGALAADTGVEDTTQVATETIGKTPYETTAETIDVYVNAAMST